MKIEKIVKTNRKSNPAAALCVLLFDKNNKVCDQDLPLAFEMQSLDFLYKYAVWHSASMHGGGYNMIHETQERDITLVCLSMGMGFQKGF